MARSRRAVGGQGLSLHSAGLAARLPSDTGQRRSRPLAAWGRDDDSRLHRRARPFRRDAGGQRHRRRLVPAGDRRPSRARRPLGAHQLRRVRHVPAVPVRRRIRDAARAEVDQDAVYDDAADRPASLSTWIWATHQPSGSGADGFLAGAVPRGRAHLPRPRDAAAARRTDRLDRRRDSPSAVHQAGHPRVGPGRPLLHAVAGPAAGAASSRTPRSSTCRSAKTFVALDDPGVVVGAIEKIGAQRPA